MGTTNKRVIGMNEYYQLIGLKALVDRYNLIIEELERTAQEITQETDFDGSRELNGHTLDYLGSYRTLDSMLSLLKIKVSDD